MAHNYYANFNRNGISHFQITPDYKRNTYQIVQIEMNKKQTQTNQIEQDKKQTHFYRKSERIDRNRHESPINDS